MANIITLARFPLLFLYLAVLYFGNQTIQYWNVPFIIVIFLMDSLDGWIARKRQETSLLGSVLDIATDRTLEYILWVVYAQLGLIPVLVPIIVLIRGTIVDGFRSVGMKSGLSAFDQVQSPVNRFLVSSRFMRTVYGISKGTTAALLSLAYPLLQGNSSWGNPVYQIALVFTWTSVVICVIRGLPVVIEGVQTFKTAQPKN